MLVFEAGNIYFVFYKMFYVLKGCAQRKFEGTESIALNLTEAGQRSLSTFDHRQPKRTMCGFGLQRSFGRIWSEYTRIITVLSDAK